MIVKLAKLTAHFHYITYPKSVSLLEAVVEFRTRQSAPKPLLKIQCILGGFPLAPEG
jgi:hypothetical protein